MFIMKQYYLNEQITLSKKKKKKTPREYHYLMRVVVVLKYFCIIHLKRRNSIKTTDYSMAVR